MISKQLILKNNLLIIVHFSDSAESLLLWGLSSSCRGQGGEATLFVVCRLLTAVSTLAAEHRLGHAGFSSCGSQAPEHRLSSCGARV